MELTDRRFKLTPKRIEALEALGIHSAEELLNYYPFRYDVLNTKPFDTWKEKERVAFEGEVVKTARTWRHGKLSTTNFEVMAYDRVLKITIFNRPWANQLALNQIVTIQGIYNGKDKITATTYDTKPIAEHDLITPVYSTRANIQQKTIRTCMERVFEVMENDIPDEMPEEFLRKYKLLRKGDALRRIHFPDNENDVKLAVRTLKYEEFLRFFIALQWMKNEDTVSLKSPRRVDLQKVKKVISDLPYHLTRGQVDALNDILKDMTSSKPMHRLVQGDVGCGKTAVAALGLYACSTAGYQSALLAPTEILAQQHYASLEGLLKNTGVHIEVLYSGLSTAEKRRIVKETEEGNVDILIGTHSIIQDTVGFQKLGMVVTDEQQRFGVAQRNALRKKGENVDFLLLSATPIPRTLASTLFGDMDVSTIETLPSGRRVPVTKYIPENSFRSVLKDVQQLLKDGRQLYVICAAVEGNEEYDARNVYDTAETLAKLFAPYKTGILHGKMSSEHKQEAMDRFYANETQVLVCTTVVEVGMNVVNATGMIIYDADRFGLSQLHQLRGRIQRGSSQGYCWLLSGNQDEKVKQRLNVLVNSNDGFEISYEDLRLRGPGDILGTRQSGIPDFILGNVIEDSGIVNTARKDALYMIEHMDHPDYSAMIDSVRARMDEIRGG